MNLHLHPNSQIPLLGIRLGTGALIGEEDLYSSTRGNWELSPVAGLVLREGNTTLWVRPTDLSVDGKEVLTYLVEHNFYLAQTSHWKVIPAPKWKNDGRMDWSVNKSECVEELINFGFITPLRSDREIYEPTEAGREFVKSLVQ